MIRPAIAAFVLALASPCLAQVPPPPPMTPQQLDEAAARCNGRIHTDPTAVGPVGGRPRIPEPTFEHCPELIQRNEARHAQQKENDADFTRRALEQLKK